MAIALGSNDNSAASPTVRDVDGSGNEFIYSTAPLVFSGSYSTGGDSLDVTPLVQAASPLGGIANLIDAFVNGIGVGTSQSAGGGYYAVLVGTALNNWKVKIFNSGGTELAAGAYPAAVTSDVVRLTTVWRKFQ